MAVEVVVRLGKPQPKQREFFLARRKFVAFGGEAAARAGVCARKQNDLRLSGLA